MLRTNIKCFLTIEEASLIHKQKIGFLKTNSFPHQIKYIFMRITQTLCATQACTYRDKFCIDPLQFGKTARTPLALNIE